MGQVMNTVAQVRIRKGITQAKLAEKAGISRPYLSAIENGKQQVISNVVMSKIAKALNTTETLLFFT